MKNKEKYIEEIMQAFISNNNCSIRKKIVLKKDSCDDDFSCGECLERTAQWLEEEYVEPLVDWSKVAVDTKILVKHNHKDQWVRRYFAKYNNGIVCAFNHGATSWGNIDGSTYWEYAKLAKEGENNEI